MTATRSQSEVERTRNQMLRVGTIKTVDAEKCTASVLIDDEETAPIPILNTRGGGNGKEWWLPAGGEQVMVFCPDGEPSNGVILGGVYQDAFPPPRKFRESTRVHRDSSVWEHNPDTRMSHIELSEGGTLFLTAPTIVLRANRVVRDGYKRAFSSDPNVKQDVGRPPPVAPTWELRDEYMRLYSGDAILDTGDVVAVAGDVYAQNVSLHDHSHICLPPACVPTPTAAADAPQVPPPETPPGKNAEDEDDTEWDLMPGGGGMGCWAHLCEHAAPGVSCFCTIFPDDPRCAADPAFIPGDCASIQIPWDELG